MQVNPPSKPVSPTEANQKHGPQMKKPVIIALVVLVIVGIIVGVQILRNKPEGRPGWLRVSGRIEGYETNVGAKIAGRVEEISNREGEQVQKGQLLVKLSDDDIRAQLRGANARWEQAKQGVREAQAQLEVAREQVQQARLNVQQSKEDAQGRIQQAQATLAAQQAQYSQVVAQETQANADLDLARTRIKRYDELVAKGAVTQDEDDQAHSNFKSASATVEARHAAVVSASKQVAAARAALMQAQSNALNPPIRMSQQQANVRTVAQQEAALSRAKLEVNNAKAAIDEIEANIAYLNINSPIDGIVTARTVEPGAVVAAGQTVISLIDLNNVYLRAYVPDKEIGKVRINQHALVYYDSDPKTGVDATVIQIDPQASFTPENIYFRDDRVKQVFGIKLLIKNPRHFAKPGMPADADIDTDERSGADDRRTGESNEPPPNEFAAPSSSAPASSGSTH
jgi:HlyD family secretion protein